MTQEQQYRTQTMYLSIWLKMKGLKFLSIDRSNPRLTFVFEDSQEREALVKEYYSQPLIQEFVGAINDMKTEMYSENPPIVYNKSKKEVAHVGVSNKKD
jgi:hypothetical protein